MGGIPLIQLKPGSEWVVQIVGEGSQGDPMVRIGALMVFLKKPAKGSYYRIKILNQTDKCGFGEVLQKCDKPQ